MGIYSAVDCAEEHATVTESMTLETGVAATVTLRCLWADRFALMADLLATPRVWPNGGFVVPPKAATASSKPFPTNYLTVGQACEYQHALVTVNYSHKIVDTISESLEPTAEFVTVDHKQFRWNDAFGPVLLEGEAPGFLVKGCNLVRTFYNQPALPPNMLDLIGKSNGAIYNSVLLGVSFPIETLLFQPPTMNRTFTTTGTNGWTLQTKFAFKPQGWNKFWRAAANNGAGDWAEIWHINGLAVYKPYPPDDFSLYLF